MPPSHVNPAPQSGASRAALGFIFFVSLLDIAGLTLLAPIQVYLVRQYSASTLMVTLLTAIYAAAQFAAAPVLGRLSDRLGRRPVLIVSVFGSAVGYFLFGLGGALWVLFLARLIDGLTGGNIAIASAYIADITPPQERARNFGLLGVAFGIGFIIGPAMGGALSQISLAAPAYAAGALSLLSALAGFFVLPESLPVARRNRQPWRWAEVNPFTPLFELLRRRELAPLLATQSIYNLVTASFNSVAVVLLIAQFHVTPLGVAGLLSTVGIANAVVQGALVGPLVRRFGEKRLAVGGLLCQAAANLGLIALPAFWMQYPVQSLASGGAGPFRPAISALLANAVPGEDQGKLNGVSTSLGSLAGVLGPLAAGAAYDHVTPVAPFVAGAALLAFAGLLLVVKVPATVHSAATPQKS